MRYTVRMHSGWVWARAETEQEARYLAQEAQDCTGERAYIEEL